MARFSPAEWLDIFSELNGHPTSDQPYGLPERRQDSVVLSSFNIRALGNHETRTETNESGRTQGAWGFLAHYVNRCDLIAIQEVRDDLRGLIRLKESLADADKYAMVVSDVTGARPGRDTSQERLAFLYRWDRIERTELASDLSYDRRAILQTLYDNRATFDADFDAHDTKMDAYREKLAEYENGERAKKPSIPGFVMSTFLAFIRTPHVTSFRVKAENGGMPLPFLAVNAHLLYGETVKERKMEFDALIDWLRWRTKAEERLYHENMILFGDLNLEFEEHYTSQEEADQAIKSMNQDIGAGYKVNFPFLDIPDKRKDPPVGDGKGRYLSTARMTQTYDQVGLFGLNGALPDHTANDGAGANGADGYDYGVFSFADLFSMAIEGNPSFLDLPNPGTFVKRFNWDVSDHHPIWLRLPVPGDGT